MHLSYSRMSLMEQDSLLRYERNEIIYAYLLPTILCSMGLLNSKNVRVVAMIYKQLVI